MSQPRKSGTVQRRIDQIEARRNQSQATESSASRRRTISRRPKKSQDTATEQTDQSDSQASIQAPQPRNENLSSVIQPQPSPKTIKKKKRRSPSQSSDSSRSADSSVDISDTEQAAPASAVQSSQQQSSPQTTIGSDPRSPATKSVVSYLTREELERLLPSYLDKSAHRQKVMAAWNRYQESGRTFNSLPQLLDVAFSGQVNKDALIEAAKLRVKQNNAAASPDLDDTQPAATVYRADSRQPEDLVSAEGFHGFGGSMSIEHARSWIKNVWRRFNRQQKAAWLQNWKAETSKPAEQVVFVATGATESQKAGTEYKVDIPLRLPASGVPGITPKAVYDGDTLDNSSIIAIAGRGEVVFLTGVATKYIQVWDPSSGDNGEYQTLV
jgi:hypothetical protein